MGSLVSILVSTVIGAYMIGHLALMVGAGHERALQAQTSGQFQDLLTAAQAYLSANESALAGLVSDGAPHEIALSSLNLLPNFRVLNPYGQTWHAYAVQPTSGQADIAIITTGDPQLNLKTLAGITNIAGSHSGYVGPDNVTPTVNSHTAVGARGGWQMALGGTFPNPGAGHLYGLASVTTGAQDNSDVLYRDNVPNHPERNTMAANLNMGGNDITNGASASFSGRIGTSGIDPNAVPPGWGGGLATLDVAAQGTIGAGPSGQFPASWINSSGNGHVDNHFDARQLEGGAGDPFGPWTGGLKLGSGYIYGDASTLNLRTPGGISIQHTGSGAAADISQVDHVYAQNSINTNTDVYAARSVIIGTAAGAYQGNSCAQNASIAAQADGSGVILHCENGKWTTGKQPWQYRATCPGWNSEDTVSHQNLSGDALYSSNGDAEFVTVTGTGITYHNGYVTQFAAYVDGNLVGMYHHEGGDTSSEVSSAVSFMVPYGSTWSVVGLGREIPLTCQVYQ
ncbi:MAG: shufflon system plasmid conjugative transfer pilus tip adhesin PilV [Gluconacetobacter sp.]